MAAWPVVGASPRVRPLHAGHIHDSYTVESAAGQGFVLQRLNGFVFPRPQAVMRNLAKALAHEGGRMLVAPIACATGETLATDAGGHCWRLFPHVPSRSFQTLPDELLEAAGAAFGSFLATFATFAEDLEPTIDGFHDLAGYLADLDAAPTSSEATAELRAVSALRETFPPGGGTQVIHGDCKINNLLFHPTAPTVAAIIDLDTMMRGDPAWDFGDLVRSAFAGAEEAATAGRFAISRFERLAWGFAQARPIDDCARYASAPAYMSFMLAVRFLADHLRGDAYFKVTRRGDNLLRARSQLALARQFLAAGPAMRRALSSVA